MSRAHPPPSKIRKVEPVFEESEDDSDDSDLSLGLSFDFMDEDIVLTAIDDLTSWEKMVAALKEEESKKHIKISRQYSKLLKRALRRRDPILRSIPDFWRIAILNHPKLTHFQNGQENDCLQYLKHLEVKGFESTIDYKLKFYFEDNPYFENEMVLKKFSLDGNGNLKSENSDILWKHQGIALFMNRKRDDQVSSKSSIEDRHFFLWLQDHTNPSDDNIAKIMKNCLWLNPSLYFLHLDVNSENAEAQLSEENEDKSSTSEDNTASSDPDVEPEDNMSVKHNEKTKEVSSNKVIEHTVMKPLNILEKYSKNLMKVIEEESSDEDENEDSESEREDKAEESVADNDPTGKKEEDNKNRTFDMDTKRSDDEEPSDKNDKEPNEHQEDKTGKGEKKNESKSMSIDKKDSEDNLKIQEEESSDEDEEKDDNEESEGKGNGELQETEAEDEDENLTSNSDTGNSENDFENKEHIKINDKIGGGEEENENGSKLESLRNDSKASENHVVNKNGESPVKDDEAPVKNQYETNMDKNEATE